MTSSAFYRCPSCGFEQRTRAVDRVRCRRCGARYSRREAVTVSEKTPDPEMGTGFVRFVPGGEG